MTTLTKLADLAKYVPEAKQTSGQHKLFVWIHKTLVRKDGE